MVEMVEEDMKHANHEEPLAIEGGTGVRTVPLPLEFPGVHHMGEEEIEAVTRVLRARSPFRYYGIDLLGETAAFEAEFAKFVGAEQALAISSGTGALHVALGALGVGPGQEIIVPAYLWVSTLAAVVNRGAIPVVADIDDTFCLDPARLESHIGDRTAGIIYVHMSGAPGDVNAVGRLANKHGLFLLEDCAQCAGGSLGGRKVGTFGDIGIFSFQMNKNMTAGEGGCLVTSDDGLYRRAFACHDLGYARNEGGRLIFDQPELCLWGMGYRMDELRAAVLRVQLRKLPCILAAMRGSKRRIRTALSEVPGIQLRRLPDPAGDTGCFLITTYKDRETALRVNRALSAEGIATFPQGVSNIVMAEWGLHLYYNNLSLVNRRSTDAGGFPWTLPVNSGLGGNCARGACPVADDLFERSILLPIPSCLTERDEDDIIRAFQKASVLL
jgi:8-amino-3,8-dideoxy-alpha-D-manno-octulosonate transaminase